MKKIYSTIMMLAMMIAALWVSSCSSSNDDDGVVVGDISKLVGTWEIVQEVSYEDGKATETVSGYGAYWVFTDGTITIHDELDMMNGTKAYYILKGDKIEVAGVGIHTIVELTSNKLVLRTMEINGTYDVITFKKR